MVAGNRGAGLAAGGAGQGRGRPPPRPVGIAAGARSVTAGAGLAFRVPGTLIGRPYPNQRQRVGYRQVEDWAS